MNPYFAIRFYLLPAVVELMTWADTWWWWWLPKLNDEKTVNKVNNEAILFMMSYEMKKIEYQHIDCICCRRCCCCNRLKWSKFNAFVYQSCTFDFKLKMHFSKFFILFLLLSLTVQQYSCAKLPEEEFCEWLVYNCPYILSRHRPVLNPQMKIDIEVEFGARRLIQLDDVEQR